MGDDLTSLTGPITSVPAGQLTSNGITISSPSNDTIQVSLVKDRIEEIENHMHNMESEYNVRMDILMDIICKLTKRIDDLEEIIRIVCDKYILNEE